MLRIDMLPAGNGDALWIEYGDQARPRRLLIDGGTRGSWPTGLKTRIETLPADQRHFELLVVTHIDADHIDGALALLQDQTLGVTYGDVWFNGWRHLPETPLESLGPVEGELLTNTIVSRRLPWNHAFDRRAVAIRRGSPPPRRELADGLSLTVLSPGPAQLAALKPVWRQALEEAGLDPTVSEQPAAQESPPPGLERLGGTAQPDVATLAVTDFRADTAEANGSSIVLLLEHEGRAVLLAGDAFPEVVLSSLQRLRGANVGSRLRLDAFKLPHHGSRFNVSSELLKAVDCSHFLFSTNGSRTHHPHAEAVARTLLATTPPSTLLFNYQTPYNEIWDDDQLREQHGYESIYASDEEPGLALSL